MRHYLTALDATVDHNVFKNVSESDYALMHLDDTPKKVKVAAPSSRVPR